MVRFVYFDDFLLVVGFAELRDRGFGVWFVLILICKIGVGLVFLFLFF